MRRSTTRRARGGGARLAVGALLVAAPLVTGPQQLASAQPSEPKNPLEAAGCPCRSEARSAVDRVVRELARQLGRVPDGATVVSAPLKSDEPAPRAEELVALVSEQLAGRLGAGVVFEPAPKREPREDAEPPGVVVLRPEIARGQLRIRADAYPVPDNVWARARSRRPGPVAHGYAVAPIDAEVRSHLQPLGIGDPEVARFEGADPGIEALACGDLDGDGQSDVVTMTRGRVLRVRLREAKVERLAEARWQQLAPIAPAPLRQPLGFATIGEGYLDVSLSDRRGSLRLDPSLRLIARMEGTAVPHGAGTACTAIRELRLGDQLSACTPHEPPPALPNLKFQSDALASAPLISEDGDVQAVVALRKDGTLVLRRGEGHSFVARAGAQLAVADLDQDGAPEMASSLDTLSPKRDAVELRTLLASGTVRRHAPVSAPEGIEALASCPPDRAGEPAPVLVATGGELWVIRWR